MRAKATARQLVFFALSALLLGCSGGSSGEKEKVYGTAVDPSTYFSPTSPTADTRSKEVRLAQCMTDQGAVVYGSRG